MNTPDKNDAAAIGGGHAGQRFAGRFCPQPFRMAQVYDDGTVYFCCPAWLPVSPGSLLDGSMDDVWNSNWAQAVRGSILDGSYRYCSEVNCPRLQGQDGGLAANDEVSDPYFRKIIDEGLTRLPRGPLELSVAYDPTCNLSCPSCRNELFKCSAEKKAEIAQIHEYVAEEALADAEIVTISTNGDPFASPFYLKILREHDWRANPERKLVLITNGLRLTPEMWASVSNCHDAITRLQISINAATAETFAINQRGGDFARLEQNLAFISALHKAGKVGHLAFSFYVLENNFREMKDFVALAKRYGADSVLFGHLMKASSHTDEVFDASAVHMPGHPLHEEFLEVLRDPALQDPIVNLFNNYSLANAAAAADAPTAANAPRTERETLDWDEFVSYFQLDNAAAETARERINWHKSEVAQLMLATPANGGPPPISLMLEGAKPDALDAFLHGNTPQGRDETYVGIMHGIEVACRDAVYPLLDRNARLVIQWLPVRSFLRVETGEDPFQAAAEAYMARRGPQPAKQ